MTNRHLAPLSTILSVPRLRAVRIWAGEITSLEQIAGAVEITQFNKLIGDLPVTFTIGVSWEEAAGKWNAKVFVAGDPMDASWEGDSDTAVTLNVLQSALRGAGSMEIVIELEGVPVYRWRVPVVDP
jgi:hypothetical protein